MTDVLKNEGFLFTSAIEEVFDNVNCHFLIVIIESNWFWD